MLLKFTGISCGGLKGKTLYPMLCSTAAQSGMKLIKARSFQTSLQFMCCQALRRIIPRHLDVFDVVRFFAVVNFVELKWAVSSSCDTTIE